MKAFEEWLEAQPISPTSPEATWAEYAWNASVQQMRVLARAIPEAEGNDAVKAFILLDTELEFLDTGNAP